jgi:CRISPR-associated protein Cas5h
MSSLDKFVSPPKSTDSSLSSKSLQFQPKKVIVFDLIGPNAHFRNVQTNSSSLSYFFPPPTTISGLIAGIIGLQRDSYYELFSPNQTFIGIEVLTPLRKELHTINYRVWTENGHTQIPLEVLFPEKGDELRYRIYFSCAENHLYQQILEKIKLNTFVYPPYLGISEFLGRTEYYAEMTIEKILPNEKIHIHSILPAESYNLDNTGELILFPEYMRESFGVHRTPEAMKKYFFISKG